MAPAPDRKYLSLFIAEAREQLEQVGTELVRLEQLAGRAPGEATPLWESIFRRVHSIKGSAGTLLLGPVVDVSHAGEALLDRLKSSNAAPERGDIDLLLEMSDLLGRLVQSTARLLEADAGTEWSPEDAVVTQGRALVRRLEVATAARRGPEKTPAPRALEPEGPKADPSIPLLDVKVQLSAKCAAPGARAMIVQRKLKALGTVLEFEPTPAQLMQTKGAATLVARLSSTRAPEEIRVACLALPEVESVQVAMAGGKVIAAAAVHTPPPIEGLRDQSITPPPVRVETELRPDPTVRVRAELLDQLLEAAGEVLGGIARVREGARRLPDGSFATLEPELDRLRRQARELHNKVVNARLVPFAALTERLPRAVRDLSHRLQKEVELEISGADVELDRAVIEALGDPLSHLVRNAVDHGIERAADRLAAGKPARGRLVLAARRERDKVFVELEDDGRGVDGAALKRRAVEDGKITEDAARELSDDEAVELAFLQGLSTRSEATDISGRGVGLDAVQRAIESLGGKLSVSSKLGKGTRFSLELPRAVSMSNLLLVQVGGELFGLPVQRVLLTTEYDLSARGGEGFESRSVIVGGQWVHAYGLAKLFGLPSLAPPGPRPFIVLEVDGTTFALSVDRLVGQEESVVKPLFPPLDRIKGLAGVTVLASGRPLLVLDPRGLFEMAGPRGLPLPPRLQAANESRPPGRPPDLAAGGTK